VGNITGFGYNATMSAKNKPLTDETLLIPPVKKGKPRLPRLVKPRTKTPIIEFVRQQSQ
jgi:hypothetical protein